MMQEEDKKSETVAHIAQTLGETEPAPLKSIKRLVPLLGYEKSRELLEEAIKIHAEEGMKTDDGTRQRTVGGVFFKLVKNNTTSKQRWRIFGAEPKPKAQPPSWEKLSAIAEDLLGASNRGIATKTRLSMSGKPGKVVEKGSVVLTSLQSGKTPTLPKGLPKPPLKPTTYLIFIADKQWQFVKRSIVRNPEDTLIIEGYPIFDKRIGKKGAFTVYAQSVTTTDLKKNQRDKRRSKGRRPQSYRFR